LGVEAEEQRVLAQGGVWVVDEVLSGGWEVEV
jgi:hypothetical protein